ncbi:MAG: PAS domain S-box-containing protein, partial [Porticoccus sp.]
MNIAKHSDQLSDSDLSNKLLKAIVEIQGAFIEESDIRASFNRMLDCLLELTGSDYGFLGEVLYDKQNQPYLLAHALTDISWDAETKKLYDDRMAKGFEFHNLNTLFGVTLAIAEVVISNDPKNDPRSGGLPQGHPGMKNYLGLPIKHRHEMIGMLGIANKDGGYTEEVAKTLNPLLLTAGAMINSIRILNVNNEIEAELQYKHKLLNGIIHNITDALIITNHLGIISEVNSATERIFGYSSQELIGRKVTKLLSDDDANVYQARIKKFISSGDRKVFDSRSEVKGIDKTKKSLALELSINDVKMGDKKLFVNIFQDIRERKSQEARLEEASKKLKDLSETDELTGLNNKRFFEKNFLKDFNRSRKVSCNLALAIIDIDHFKSYND